jgi:hypothetical protein
MPPPLATRWRAELLAPPTVKLPTSFPSVLHAEVKSRCETSASCRPEAVQELTVQDLLADGGANVRLGDVCDETVNTFLQLFAIRFRAKAVDVGAGVRIVNGVCAGTLALVHGHGKRLEVARFMSV